jgi:hypothetical protein
MNCGVLIRVFRRRGCSALVLRDGVVRTLTVGSRASVQGGAQQEAVARGRFCERLGPVSTLWPLSRFGIDTRIAGEGASPAATARFPIGVFLPHWIYQIAAKPRQRCGGARSTQVHGSHNALATAVGARSASGDAEVDSRYVGTWRQSARPHRRGVFPPPLWVWAPSQPRSDQRDGTLAGACCRECRVPGALAPVGHRVTLAAWSW